MKKPMVIDTRIVFSIQNTNLYGPFIFLKEWYNLDFKDSPFNYQTLFYFLWQIGNIPRTIVVFRLAWLRADMLVLESRMLS